MPMCRVGMRSIPSPNCITFIVMKLSMALMATAVAAGAFAVIGDGRRRRGRPSFLAPLSFSKIAATDATPTTTASSLPLTFFRNPPHNRYPDSITTVLLTTMTLSGGDGAVDGDGKTDASTDSVNTSQLYKGQQQEGRETEEGRNGSTSAIEAVEDEEVKIVAVHTYHRHDHRYHIPEEFGNGSRVNNTSYNLTLMGVGMSSRQFASWVHYYLTHMTKDGEATTTPSTITTTTTKTTTTPPTTTTPLRSEAVTSTATNIIPQTPLEENSKHLSIILEHVSTQEFHWENEYEGDEGEKITEEEETTWLKIRQFWKEGKLICENTNLLSSPRSRSDRRRSRRRLLQGSGVDNLDNSNMVDEVDVEQETQVKDEERYRQEKFRNALESYADRLVSIVEDELGDDSHVANDNVGEEYDYNYATQDMDLKPTKRTMENNTQKSEPQGRYQRFPKWTTPKRLLGWIENEYGIEKTQQLMADSLLTKSEKEQLETIKTFMEWFKSNFPYFLDKCDFCGVSCKDDPVQAVNGVPAEDGIAIEQDHLDYIDDVEQNDEQTTVDDFSCLGYVRPTPSELRGGASRTELYRCRSCLSYTRFPRYNKALWVTAYRRGRCGEYSMLLYRMLRALGYVGVRWCVDWSDHVWVEVWLGNGGDKNDVERCGRWVHLDPCEAAVDNPLLYESWGKNQTYIVAFHDPFYERSGERAMSAELEMSGRQDNLASERIIGGNGSRGNVSYCIENGITRYRFPPVEDVTRRYTSDEVHMIVERRGVGENPVAEAIKEVSGNMVESLQKLSPR